MKRHVVYGNDAKNTSIDETFNNPGLLYRKLDKYDKARENFERVAGHEEVCVRSLRKVIGEISQSYRQLTAHTSNSAFLLFDVVVLPRLLLLNKNHQPMTTLTVNTTSNNQGVTPRASSSVSQKPKVLHRRHFAPLRVCKPLVAINDQAYLVGKNGGYYSCQEVAFGSQVGHVCHHQATHYYLESIRLARRGIFG
jgi:hypothetical protein